MRVASALPLATTVVALLVGCGGEDSAGNEKGGFAVRADTTMTTGPLPKARFIARVNQICRNGWIVILDNFAKYSSWQSDRLTEEELFAKSVRLSYLAGLDFHIFDEIYRLGAPEGEERDVEEVIGTMQIAVEKGQRVITVPTTTRLVALFSNYNRIASDYGLDECLVKGRHLPKTA